MNNDSWKIIYSSFEGVEQRAIELLSAEMGRKLLRNPGEYAIYSLACEPATRQLPTGNAVVAGVRGANPVLQYFMTEDEIPDHGYRIRIVAHPEESDKQLVLIAAAKPAAVLYGVIDFVDDVLPLLAPFVGDALRYENRVFHEPLPLFEKASRPETLTRSIFTWGHQINDFRDYIQNMARLKFNELIIWNEYPPLNAREVLDYAHSWGIRVLWGFAWGWSTNCTAGIADDPAEITRRVLADWRENWSKLKGDGIYFQTFTELRSESVGGQSVVENAVALVNRTAAELLNETPGLRIVFGLHASSVKTRLDVIARTDERLEILWEDCGGFPYNAGIRLDKETDAAFTEMLLSQKHRIGIAVKCQLMMDWTTFRHQAGPYVLGCAPSSVLRHDREFALPFWRYFKELWLEHGEYACELVRRIHAADRGDDVMLNLVGNLSGAIQWPTALAAELFWNTEEPYAQIRARVLRRSYLCDSML